ncbi:MAG: hypothetical protein N3Z28_00710 [Synechococcaceae cyanobacterium MAG-AL2]|uniref:hypothetical protein n=1 Tax=Candidatus Regnicoccus frigidus TaxID=3074015 RepID=UPI002816A693|nr:hypothetical protein [Candidatus Regnicoccus frigidus]MCT4366174.1 hypothetical protein [Candidatus Regnicoccus frigidus MAG-AL2]
MTYWPAVKVKQRQTLTTSSQPRFPFPREPTSSECSPFGQFLFSQRNGATHTELGEGLAKVVEAVLANGGSGSVTLKINVKLLGHESRIVVTDDVVIKAPQPAKQSSIWFYNKNAKGLSRRDPNQTVLELSTIPMRPRLGQAFADEGTP